MKIQVRHIACDVEVDLTGLPRIDTKNPWYTDTSWAYAIARRYRDYWIPEPYTNVGGGERITFSQETVVASDILYAVCKLLEGKK